MNTSVYGMPAINLTVDARVDLDGQSDGKLDSYVAPF